MPPVDVKELFDAVESDYFLKVSELLGKPGVDVNVKNKEGSSLLHKAIELGRLCSLGMLLLRPNLNVNITDKNSNTPLVTAIIHNQVDLAEMLLKDPQINVNSLNNDMMTPLHIAVMHENIEFIQLLLSRSDIKITEKDKNGHIPLDLLKDSTSPKTEEIRQLLFPYIQDELVFAAQSNNDSVSKSPESSLIASHQPSSDSPVSTVSTPETS